MLVEITVGVFVVDTFAYLADGSAGLRIINVSNPAIPIETGLYNTSGQAAGVYVIDAFAYVADNTGGFKIINVSNPAIPIETGSYTAGGWAKAVHVVDTFAYIADDSSGLRIINVSNPAAPVEIGYYDTGGFANGLVVIDIFAYVVNGPIGMCIIKYPMGAIGIKNEKFNNDILMNNYYIKYNTNTIDMYFGLKEKGELILDIYDKMGRKLNTLNNSIVENGYTKIAINKSDYVIGEYFIKGKMNNTDISFKITILR